MDNGDDLYDLYIDGAGWGIDGWVGWGGWWVVGGVVLDFSVDEMVGGTMRAFFRGLRGRRKSNGDIFFFKTEMAASMAKGCVLSTMRRK